MKKLTFLAFIALLLLAVSTSSAKTFNWKDVRDMSEAGVPDDIIIQKINATDLVFELNGDEIIDLWEAGVSEKVITAMLKTETPVDEEKGEEILQDQKGDKDQANKGDEDNGYDNRTDATPPSYDHSHVSIGLGFGFGYPLPYYSYSPYGYAYPYFGYSNYPYVSHYHYYPYGGYYQYPYGGGGGGGGGSYTRQRTIVGPSTKGYYGYRSYGGGMVSGPRVGGFYRGGFSGGARMMRVGGFGGFRGR